MFVTWNRNLASRICRAFVPSQPGRATRLRRTQVENLEGRLGPAVRNWTGPLSSSWSIVRVTDGYLLSGVLGSFTYPHTKAVPGSVAAKIDWGDGKTSAGVIGFDVATNRFKVTGQHTYVEEGSFTIKTSITDVDTRHHLGGILVIVLTDVTVSENT